MKAVAALSRQLESLAVMHDHAITKGIYHTAASILVEMTLIRSELVKLAWEEQASATPTSGEKEEG